MMRFPFTCFIKQVQEWQKEMAWRGVAEGDDGGGEMLRNELSVQVCDATGDTIKNFSPAHKKQFITQVCES